MAGVEDWQSLEQRNSTGEHNFAADLSQSTQDLFKASVDFKSPLTAPQSLDFGTGAELYLSSAYTSDRLLASSIMTDNAEQKLDAARVQKTAEATAEAGVINGQANQTEHEKAFKLLHAEDKNPSGIMPALHESFGITGNLTAFDLGKSKGTDSVVAVNDDYLNRSELAEKIEKKTPHDGEKPHLKDFFDNYKTPVMDAYEHSKSLKDGQPGKSKTLESVIDRLKDCPWLDQIFVKYNSHADNPEYDNHSSTITLRPQDSVRQVQNFGHEGFHATHQFLSKLYDHGKVSAKEFEDIFMQGEVDSMLTEAKIQQETNPNGKPVMFHFYGADGKPASIDVQDYVNKHGKQAFVEFLRTARQVGDNAEPYGKHYASFYQRYLDNFDGNKPAVDKYIKQWVAAGHKREDI